MTTKKQGVAAVAKPNTVHICGVPWEIKWQEELCDDDGDEVHGLTRKNLGYIIIGTEQAEGAQRVTLLHELIHAASAASGWNAVDLDQLMSARSGGVDGRGGIDVEEIFVSNIESPLMSILCDPRNASLLAWLCQS